MNEKAGENPVEMELLVRVVGKSVGGCGEGKMEGKRDND